MKAKDTDDRFTILLWYLLLSEFSLNDGNLSFSQLDSSMFGIVLFYCQFIKIPVFILLFV